MTDVKRAADLLDQQAALVRWWKHSPWASGFADGFQWQMDRVTGPLYRLDLQKFMINAMFRAEPVFVSPHIVDRLWDFAKTYDSTDPFTEHDLPFNNGYCWLATPLYMSDPSEKMLSVRAFSWHRVQDGIITCWFNDRDDPYDEISMEIQQNFPYPKMIEPRTPLLQLEAWPFGRDLRNLSKTQLTPDADLPYERSEPVTERGLEDSFADTNLFHRFVFALWEFMADQIPATAMPDRAARRRAERAGLPHREVKVVDLRATIGGGERNPNPEPVERSHRWPVREHKRTWVDKRGVIRTTTVRAHIKGPEGKPLIERPQVVRVSR